LRAREEILFGFAWRISHLFLRERPVEVPKNFKKNPEHRLLSVFADRVALRWGKQLTPQPDFAATENLTADFTDYISLSAEPVH